MVKAPGKDRSQQCTEGKVQKIDHSGCCPTELRWVGFLNYGVRKHGDARSHPGDQPDRVRREHTDAAEQNPAETGDQHYCASDNDWLTPSNAIGNEADQWASN